MSKSIHERVRATLAKQAREQKRVVDNAVARQFARSYKRDADFEKGIALYNAGENCPLNANTQVKCGFETAFANDFDGM